MTMTLTMPTTHDTTMIMTVDDGPPTHKTVASILRIIVCHPGKTGQILTSDGLDLTFRVPNYIPCKEVSSKSSENCDRKSVDRQTNVTDTGNFTICPSYISKRVREMPRPTAGVKLLAAPLQRLPVIDRQTATATCTNETLSSHIPQPVGWERYSNGGIAGDIARTR